jgi:hypothetical protein
VVFAAFFITGYFFTKPVLLSIANKELHKVFKQSSIGGLKITRDFIEFYDVKIKEPGYGLKIRETKVYYSLSSILKKKIDKIEALDANVDFTKNDIKIKGTVSLRLDMAANTLDYIKLNVFSCNTDLVKIEGLVLNASQGSDAGEFHIKGVKYNDLKIADVAGKTELKGRLLRVNHLLVGFLGGNISGEFNLTLDQDMDYNLSVNTQDVEIKRFVDDMKFNEKFNMTGTLAGAFYLSGKGEEIKDIKGDFYTEAVGGVLVIKDKTFLENIAKQSNQPLNIIMESFSNYNYNNGIVKLSAETGALAMDLKLEGESGKRSLTIILHEFNKRKERQ